MILEIFCSFIVLCCVLLYITNLKDKRLEEIPGPRRYPIIGNIFEFLTSPEKIWSSFRKLSKIHYPIYVTHQVSIPLVHIIKPEDMKIVMSSTMHLSKGITYKPLEPWLNTGLLTSSGKKWQHRRKLVTPTFHINILQQFLVTFNEHTLRLLKRLENECSKPFTEVVPVVTETTLQLISGRNLQTVNHFTSLSILETAMGTHLVSNTTSSINYMNSVCRIGELIIQIVFNPLYQIPIVSLFTPTIWEFKKLLSSLHGFTKNVISHRKENFDEAKLTTKRMALLDLLIKAQKVDKSIDDEGIREEVDTFMFGGHDTTTACISFTLMLLANHFDIQNKVVDELADIFEDSDRMPTYQDLQNMNYLEQVIKESLRLYPSVPSISRLAGEDFQTSSNYTIPKGTEIGLHIYDLHHSEHIYPDPEKFDPERFSPENSKNRHPYAYIPFSAGPRSCIGQKFALLEVKTVISSILRHFELLPVDTPLSIQLTLHLVIKSITGVKVKFVKRL